MIENKLTLDTMNVDTSSLTTTDVSDKEFYDGITDKLQNILNHEFPGNYEKQRIRTSPAGLNFACPFCHDSASDNHKKRGYFILNGRWAGRFKCFNCGESMKIQKFFSDFNTNLTLSDVNYIKNTFETTTYDSSKIGNQLTSNIVSKDEALQWAIDRDVVKSAFGLSDIDKIKTPLAWNYLTNRCQYKNFERFLYSEKYQQVLILNLVDNKVLGMQLRNIGANKLGGAKYLTMTIEKMRASILGDNTPVPDVVSKLSCVFNIFCVDFAHTYNTPVLVTEGPFDAFLLPNCIALSGASKNFNMQFPFWYVFDDDQTGSEHAIEKLRAGYNVFMWKKFKTEYGIPDINPYISNGNKRKWDVTDIMKYVRDYNVSKKLLWSPYFTNSMLNGLNI